MNANLKCKITKGVDMFKEELTRFVIFIILIPLVAGKKEDPCEFKYHLFKCIFRQVDIGISPYLRTSISYIYEVEKQDTK